MLPSEYREFKQLSENNGKFYYEYINKDRRKRVILTIYQPAVHALWYGMIEVVDNSEPLIEQRAKLHTQSMLSPTEVLHRGVAIGEMFLEQFEKVRTM